MNSFVFLLNSRSTEFESDCLIALGEIIDIIGPAIEHMEAKSFEIRFTHVQLAQFSSLCTLARCFASMHEHGLEPVRASEERIIDPTTASRGDWARLLRTAVNHMFTLGSRLARTSCPKHKKGGPKMLDCKTHDNMKTEFDRFTQCKGSKCKGEFFMRDDVLEWSRQMGLNLPKVSTTRITGCLFTDTAQATQCPTGCCHWRC